MTNLPHLFFSTKLRLPYHEIKMSGVLIEKTARKTKMARVAKKSGTAWIARTTNADKLEDKQTSRKQIEDEDNLDE